MGVGRSEACEDSCIGLDEVRIIAEALWIATDSFLKRLPQDEQRTLERQRPQGGEFSCGGRTALWHILIGCPGQVKPPAAPDVSSHPRHCWRVLAIR